jgi:hypothetical protein
MTPADGAILLIGLNVSRLAKDSPKQATEFGQKTQQWTDNRTINGLCEFGNTLTCDLERLIVSCSGTVLRDQIDRKHMDVSVQFHMPLQYTMLSVRTVPGEQNDYQDEIVCSGLYGSPFGDIKVKSRPDRTDIAIITHRTIVAVADFIAA